MNKYIPGEGSIGSKLMILTECPTYQDSQNGKLLSSSDGAEFDRVLRESTGLTRASTWITSVSKYYVPPNRKGKKVPFHLRAKAINIDIDEQINDLRNEINSIKPNCILALGSTPLWALTGKTDITNFRGSILFSGMGRKFVPSYNPAQLGWHSEGVEFKGYYNRALMVFDFKRAYEQSKYSEYKVPQRRLEIIKSSYQLYEFFEQHNQLLDMAVDIEAGGTMLPVCIGFSLNPKYGVTVPLWNRDGISDMSDSEIVNCWRIISEKLYEKEIIGQNFNYDRDKIKRLGFIIRSLKSDIMLKGFAINPELPKRLASNQSLYTEEPFYKDEGMYHGTLNDLMMGCARDACVTLEIDQAMEPDLVELGQKEFYYNYLMTLPEFYLEIENNGLSINTDTRDNLLRKYIAWDERLRYELWNLVGENVNTNSPKQVTILLFEKLKCPIRKGTGEEELTALLNLQSFTNSVGRRACELILESRRVRKSISTYLMALPDYDGRMKTTCFPCLETGRSSTGQQDPPIRPEIEIIGEDGKKKKKSMGIAFQTMTKHGDIGSDIRSMYEPW